MTHGSLRFAANRRNWQLTAPPHVRMRIKRLFKATENQSGETLTIGHTGPNARDLLWIMERYPLEMDSAERNVLLAASEADKEIEADAHAIRTGSLILPPVELALPARDYQRIAIDLWRTVRGMMCADDLGLGKTIVGIAAAADTRPAIVVTKSHLQKQWERQFKTFAPGLRVHIAKTGRPYHFTADVLILTYSKLVGWQHMLAAWGRAIVFDEVQELRHATSEKYKAAAVICESQEGRLGLTATPVYNYGGEMFNIMNLLSPGCLGASSEFMAEWCSYSKDETKMVVSDPRALGLYLRQQGVMIRRTRADVGKELPAVQKLAHSVEYNEKVFDRLKNEAVQLARTILSSTANFNEKGIATRQLDLKLRQATGIAKAPFVADFAADLVGSGENLIVTAWHREVFTILCNEFRRHDIPFFMFTGSESPKQKDDAVKGFLSSERPAVFLMSIRSGDGIDGLQMKASTIVHAELDWSPQVHAQADGRLQRDGQAKPVSSIYLVADGGSDPIISGVLGVKYEQGLGITDPTMNVADVAAAATFEAQADTNRIAALARSYLAKYAA